MSKFQRTGLALMGAGLAFASLARRRASQARSHVLIRGVMDRDTAFMGETIAVRGEVLGVPSYSSFSIQHRMGQGRWRTIGKSWLGLRYGNDYCTYLPPLAALGAQSYRLKVSVKGQDFYSSSMSVEVSP